MMLAVGISSCASNVWNSSLFVDDRSKWLF